MLSEYFLNEKNKDRIINNNLVLEKNLIPNYPKPISS